MYDAIIIGGGPAGSSAGISLARAGLRVAIIEKDVFPRNRLCGEFISNDGSEILDALGLKEKLLLAGASIVTSVVVTTDSSVYEGDAPVGAISFSRRQLDAMLLEEARASGADVWMGESAKDVSGNLTDGFLVKSSESEWRGRTVICAAGRAARLVRKLHATNGGAPKSRIVAFKRHYVGDMPAGRVELHTFDGGYCGVQRIEHGTVNACWITRASVLQDAGGKPDSMIEYMTSKNRRLRHRMVGLEPKDQEFLAVSQLDFSPKSPVAGDILMIGDSAGMIAPLCGDGIGMALHSGAVAARLVEAFVTGSIDSAALRDRYVSIWRKTFLMRMWLGRGLHVAMEDRKWCTLGIRTCRAFPGIARWLTVRTRR